MVLTLWRPEIKTTICKKDGVIAPHGENTLLPCRIVEFIADVYRGSPDGGHNSETDVNSRMS